MFGELHSPGDTYMYIIIMYTTVEHQYLNLVYPNSPEAAFYYEYHYKFTR